MVTSVKSTTVFVLRASYDRNTYRDIAIRDSASLYQLAESIINAFDFDFDHAFGFYNHLHDPYLATMRYELFADLDPKNIDDGVKGVQKTKISELFHQPKDAWAMLFDYGDDWLFKVELREIREKADKEKLPVMVLSKGDAPVQYPDDEA